MTAVAVVIMVVVAVVIAAVAVGTGVEYYKYIMQQHVYLLSLSPSAART